MCVIARGTGLSPEARTSSRDMGHFFGTSTTGRTLSLSWNCSLMKPGGDNLATISLRHSGPLCVSKHIFRLSGRLQLFLLALTQKLHFYYVVLAILRKSVFAVAPSGGQQSRLRRDTLFSSCSQSVGVLRSLLPASLFEHLSMDQARNPPT